MMSTLESLAKTIAAQPSHDLAIEALLAGLADRIKATSNDQNIQRLAQALRAEGPAIIAAIAARREV